MHTTNPVRIHTPYVQYSQLPCFHPHSYAIVYVHNVQPLPVIGLLTCLRTAPQCVSRTPGLRWRPGTLSQSLTRCGPPSQQRRSSRWHSIHVQVVTRPAAHPNPVPLPPLVHPDRNGMPCAKTVSSGKARCCSPDRESTFPPSSCSPAPACSFSATANPPWKPRAPGSGPSPSCSRPTPSASPSRLTAPPGRPPIPIASPSGCATDAARQPASSVPLLGASSPRAKSGASPAPRRPPPGPTPSAPPLPWPCHRFPISTTIPRSPAPPGRGPRSNRTPSSQPPRQPKWPLRPRRFPPGSPNTSTTKPRLPRRRIPTNPPGRRPLRTIIASSTAVWSGVCVRSSSPCSSARPSTSVTTACHRTSPSSFRPPSRTGSAWVTTRNRQPM